MDLPPSRPYNRNLHSMLTQYTWPSKGTTTTTEDHNADAGSETSNSSASDEATDSDAGSTSGAEALRLRALSADDRPPELAHIRPTNEMAKT